MTRTLLIGFALACTLLLSTPAAGEPGLGERKQAVDSKIDRLQGKIDAAREREGVLSSQIEVVTREIRVLQGDVDAASARLNGLEGVLALHRRKLDHLNELFRLQTSRLVFLQRQHEAATSRLNRRVVEIYTSERTEPLAVVLEASSFGDMLDQLEFLNDIGSQDEKIATEVEAAKIEVRETRNATRLTRNQVAETTRLVAARTAEQRQVRDRLAWSQRQLATARREKSVVLGSVRESKEQYISEVDGLLAQSASLAEKIRAAQSQAAAEPVSATRRTSSTGFVWPVQGPLTSPFGFRWGRMHEGIDIAVPTGTPVVASAAGTVIVAGWMGGYGNLVVVDHGNGISTAYAHNSSLAAGVGQSVAQGQLIAYAGNTGHSFGPHLHFEVRINGSAADPLGYL
ncbi:MAG: peptidoglycan DD-metalloendopeptidase family protein [Gaiellaceae bacterium MAG52_C11]|nr:peptidoglycan DD-metalloendopeptidase family protein [Candidatus Gaiellasilicea maunaloa]